MVPLIVLKLFDAIKWAHEIAGTDNQVVSRVKEDAKKTIGFSRDMADGRVLPAAKNGYIKDDISSRLSVSKSLGLLVRFLCSSSPILFPLGCNITYRYSYWCSA